MKKNIIKGLFTFTLSILSLLVIGLTKVEVKAEESSADWMPFNYVLTDGFGSAMKYLDVRTDVKVENGKITASGRTTKGGMGMTYLPEINLDGFKINVSVNSFQEVSPDRWFGFTLTDVGVKNDEYNEVPFYSKHSESWSVDYGAGTLFAFRPNQNGAMQIQFNFLGIAATYDGDGKVAANAGEYNDGFLGWGGWLSTIQLYNEDWSLKTDYNNIEMSIKAIKENDKVTGYAFDINKGYWKRTDTVDWANLATDVFALLDADESGDLSQTEKDNFLYGPAWETSVIPYANWGETYLALVNYEKMLKENGKRLYLSFMYKDTWDIREDVADASFTINSINGGAATTMTSFDIDKDQVVTGEISATLTKNSLHAGVYPSMVKSLKMVDATEKSYKSAKANIETQASGKQYKVFNVKGVTNDDKEVALIEQVKCNFDLSKYKDATLYKLVGTDLDPVSDITSVKVSSSTTTYVLIYGGEQQTAKKGCGSSIAISIASLLLIPTTIVICRKKKEN